MEPLIFTPSNRPMRSLLWNAAGAKMLDGMNGAIVGADSEGWPEKPISVQFSITGETGFVVLADDKEGIAWLRQWLPRQRVFLHSGITTDLPIFEALGIELPRYDDTIVMAYHYMQRSGSGILEQESQNLGTLAYRFCHVTLGELSNCPGVDFDLRQIPITQEFLQYAGEDACAEFLVAKALLPILEEVQELYDIDMGQVGYCRDVMRNGLPIDEAGVYTLYGETVIRVGELTDQLQAMAARRGVREFNPASHPQVRDILTTKYGLRMRKRTKAGKASTSEKALVDFKEHEFVGLLQKHREAKKQLGTYIQPLLDACNGDE